MKSLFSGLMGNDASTPEKHGSKKDLYTTYEEDMPSSDDPVIASFAGEDLTIGAGVAIFHLASERVIVCYHSKDGYWFLPKGRRDASEETGVAAEREGFEEVIVFVTFILGHGQLTARSLAIVTDVSLCATHLCIKLS